MRGERRLAERCSYTPDGSSPHARGTPQQHHTEALPLRFIPACAGNATTITPRFTAKTVHPRMRGERSLRLAIHWRKVGSSPHARGTPIEQDPQIPGSRFIPACAGNARPRDCCPEIEAVHPRMRGERSWPAASVWPNRGSSPHARGTPGVTVVQAASVRFIPACAGNASAAQSRRRPPTVHPRMRGERLKRIACCGEIFGSSPHARGTPSDAARARAMRTVHPRMRGERQVHIIPFDSSGGSSPHARGTRASGRGPSF